MSIDLTTVLKESAQPLIGLAAVVVLIVGAYLADCLFSPHSRHLR